MTFEQLYTREITIYALTDRVTREHMDEVMQQISLALGLQFTDYSGTSPVMQFRCWTPGFIKQRSVAEKKLQEVMKNVFDIEWNVSYRKETPRLEVKS